MKNNNPIKQHTVSNFLIKVFADKNFLVWIYDKNKKEIRKQPTADTTVNKDFYTIEIKGKLKDYQVETNLFANGIEKEFKPIFSDIIKNKKILGSQEDIIRLFVLFQYGRTTIFKKRWGKIKKREWEEYIMKKYKTELEKEGVKKIKVSPHKNTNLKGMIEIYESLEKDIEKMDFLLLESKGIGNEQFITSDNPVVIISTKRIEERKMVISIMYFPLSPKITLIVNDYSISGLKKVNKEAVNFLNRYIYNQSDQYIISRGRKYLSNFIKMNINSKINQTDFEKFKKAIYQSR